MSLTLMKRWRSRPAPPAPTARRASVALLWLLPLLLLAFLIGAVAGLDSPLLLLLLAGPLLVLMLFFLVHAEGMLLALFVVTFLIQGSLMYFWNLRQATWIAVGMAVLFLLRQVTDQTARAGRRVAPPQAGSGVIILPLLAYASCYAVSYVANRPHLPQLVASLKAVWPMFGVMLALYWSRWSPQHLERLWRALLLVTLLQVPVVLYQHFIVAPKRMQGFDSVVGTFGGSMLGGGMSAILVVFVLVTLAYAAAAWHRGQLGTRSLLLFGGLCLLIILMGEVKAAFIWLPLVLVFVLRARILKNTVNLVSYGLLTLALLAALYYAYNMFYWNDNMSRLGSVSEKLAVGGGYFFDVNNINYTTGEISRGASLALWFHDYIAGPLERLIGFGPGASKSGTLGTGIIAQRYRPLYIDTTSLTVLLWEVGVCGALAYIAMLLGALRAGWRLLKAGRLTPVQQAGVEASLVTLGLSLSLIVYNRTMMDEPTMQLLLMFAIGYILQLLRFGAAPAQPARPLA